MLQVWPGGRPQQKFTAVVLSANPNSQFDWTPTRNVIVSILDSIELWHIAVYIVPEVIWRGPAMS